MLKAKWITFGNKYTDACPIFRKDFLSRGDILSATLRVSARGVYEAKLNGERVGDFILAPGWTVYEKRIQLQSYDVTDLIRKENSLQIELASGWYLGSISGLKKDKKPLARKRECAVIAELKLKYKDGSLEIIGTDEDWTVAESKLRFCDFYSIINLFSQKRLQF